MLNYTVIMGRLTRDPELRRTQSGTAVTSFSIACERDIKNQDGKRETDFLEVVAWRQTAEFVCKYFAKGSMIVVDGRLQVRDWKDQNGNNRRSTEILAGSVYFGDSKKEGTSVGGESQPHGAPEEYAAPMSGMFNEVEEDGELPF